MKLAELKRSTNGILMAIVNAIVEAMKIIETIGGMVRGDDIMFIRVSLHVMNVCLSLYVCTDKARMCRPEATP